MGRDRDSSRTAKKRKAEEEEDEIRERRRDRRGRSESKSRSRSISPPKEKRRHRSPSPEKEGKGGGASESLSIDETNRLRAQLGLAPLENDDGPKVQDAVDGNLSDKIVKEDGAEFRHRKAGNMGEKKRDQEIRDKIEVAKKKREVYSKVLKSKGLADSDSEEDTSNWVEKMRKQEEEKKKAAERAKMLDQMDEEFGVNSMIEDEKAKQSRKKARELAKKRATEKSVTGGLTIGHGKDSFLAGQDQILVLEDKDVLDDGEEVLVNPNLIDNERTKKNVELRKRKGGKGFEDELDEWGNPKDYGVLSKYDEELEGSRRETFRLDEKGQVDMEKEREEEAMRRRLAMAGKTLVSLDDSNKFNRATEFYTQEEMISFRKVKKSKDGSKMRKRKGGKGGMLKADDLVAEEPAGGKNMGSRNRRRRNEEEEEEEGMEIEIKKEGKEAEDGEIDEDNGMPESGGKWKKATKGAVDLDALKKIVEREVAEEEDSDDDLIGGVDLTDVVLDDDVENELASVIDRTRRLKQTEAKRDVLDSEAVAKKVVESLNLHETNGGIKMEVDEDYIKKEVVDDDDVLIDSTMEYCRNIGEIPTYGLAGNRQDAIDEDYVERYNDEDDEEAAVERLRLWKEQQQTKEKTHKQQRGGWTEASTSRLDSDDEETLERAGREMKMEYNSDGEEEDQDEEESHNVLGEEADVTKGVGAMLKLAAQKGYLTDPNAKKSSGDSLEHLKNRRFTQLETSTKYDIEEKYTKKLEKMGTTGRGPTMDFSEKKDYNPEINIMYTDEKGREMEPKDAFRKLSWKFHGKGPGKKQFEKRARRMDQKEMLKQMNSSDTPLGTLSKQLKKQEQLQTPYLVLSGNASHQNFKKE